MKLLILGCGSIGERHILNLKKFFNVGIIAVDSDSKKLSRIKRIGGVETNKSYQDALNGNVDAVLICTPTNTHVKFARLALKKNKHVFIEKPISHTLAGVDEIIQLAARKKLLIFVGFNLRYFRSLNKIKEEISLGKIGKVISVRSHFGSYLPWRHPGQDYRKDYGAKKALGGGVLLDVIHEMDYVTWLFGRPKTLFCLGGKLSSLEMDAEDTAEILFFSESNSISSIHLDFIQRPYQRWCEIIGEKGTIKWVFGIKESKLSYFDVKKKKWKTASFKGEIDGSYVQEMKHFISCVRGKSRPFVDGKRAKYLLSLSLKARESMEKKKLLKC